MAGRRGGDIWKTDHRPWVPPRPAKPEEVRRAARYGKRIILRPDPRPDEGEPALPM